MGSPTGTSNRKGAQGKGAQTRDAILQAAIARFGREGYRSTSVADIARDAGVSGTLAYAYFPSKEALFFDAVDEDAASVIHDVLSRSFTEIMESDWRERIIFTALAALEDHPLARRLLAGREPEVTARVLEIPAINDLRTACADRLRTEQEHGAVRPDIDPVVMGNGLVAIILSLLMSVVQLGGNTAVVYGADVAAVLEAAVERAPRLTASR